MKQLIYSILSVLALSLVACTENNGKIGDLFGSWVLEEVSIDGRATDMARETPTVFSFQANVVRVTYYSDEYYHFDYFGTWTRTEQSLDFDFTHHNASTEPGQEGYSAPTWLDFENGVVTHTTITRLDKGRLEFVRTTPDGQTYLYKFARTW